MLYLRYVALVFIFFILSACNGHNKNSNELLFWCSNNAGEINFGKSVTDTWNKAHANQPVHMQPIPEGQSSEEVILAAVVGKTTPDIYANMWQGNVEMYARSGSLIALDTLQGFMDFIKDRCDSSVIKEITSANGHIYQVPWKVNPLMTIYNVNAFNANNISHQPNTYSNYLNDAQIFKNNTAGKSPQKWFGYTEVKEIWYQRLYNFYPLYVAASNGAPLIQNNKAAFNNKYAVQVFRFLQTIYNNGYFTRENLAASNDPFATERIVTVFAGPWETDFLLNFPGRNFKFTYLPPPVPDDHTGPVYTYADPKNIVIFNTCKHPQQAWNFIRTMVDKEGDLKLLQFTGQMPQRKNLANDVFYSNYFQQNPINKIFAKQVAHVKGIDNSDVIVEVLDIISQEYASCVIYGKKTPEKAISDAAKQVDVLLANNK